MIKLSTYGPVKAFQLARTFLDKSYYHTACYFIDGLLIDSGCAHTVNELDRALINTPVHTVINTHHHEDHVGGNLVFEQKGACILASKLACPIINGTICRPPLMLYQRILWGWPKKSMAMPLNKYIESENYKFQIIHTPGHSPDHVCLYEPTKGWLFSGDAYIGGREKSIRRNNNIWDIIASLKQLASLNISLIFTGSGSVIKSPAQNLNKKIDYLESKGKMIIEYYRLGFSINKIRKIIFGHHPPIYYLTMGDFSSKNLILSYLKKYQPE